MTGYRNRIIGSTEMLLDDILFNPKNWRIHPRAQQEALEGVVQEVGWVDKVIVNQRTGHLVDGHLRCMLAKRAGETHIPVDVVDLSEEEEDLIIATFDPISAMAASDKEKLETLLENASSDNEKINELFERMKDTHKLFDEDSGDGINQLDIDVENPKTDVSKGDVITLGIHTLICASPVNDLGVWKEHLVDKRYFLPYPTPFTLFSDKACDNACLLISPDPIICGYIVDQYRRING